MKISDLESDREVSDLDRLRAVLTSRYGNHVNSFVLSHGNDNYPRLLLVVEDDCAGLAYEINQDVVFTSVGNQHRLKNIESTPFFINERIQVTNHVVLPFSAALEAAQQFFITKELPQSVEWQEYVPLLPIKDVIINESEWFSCSDPVPMLRFLEGKVSDRKLRLFGVVCCHRIEYLFPDKDCREAIFVAEKYCDGFCSAQELEAAQTSTWTMKSTMSDSNARGKMPAGAIRRLCDLMAYNGIKNSVQLISSIKGCLAGDPDAKVPWAFVGQLQACQIAESKEKAIQVSLLREIIGNPFRPINFPPSWVTPNVLQMAQSIYNDKAFERMPLLANELEKNGCISQKILSHSREPGPHVKGCWAVDLVLGKK